MRPGYNEAWVTYVDAVMKKHGASLRSQRQRTGLAHTTVSSWLQGVTPGLEGALAFIRGFGEDDTEGLRAAGYDTVHSPTNPAAEESLNAADYLIEEWTKITEVEHPDVVVPFPRLHNGVRALTLEKAEKLIADLRDKIARGVLPKKSA